jgi:hypothetical protein
MSAGWARKTPRRRTKPTLPCPKVAADQGRERVHQLLHQVPETLQDQIVQEVGGQLAGHAHEGLPRDGVGRVTQGEGRVRMVGVYRTWVTHISAVRAAHVSWV